MTNINHQRIKVLLIEDTDEQAAVVLEVLSEEQNPSFKVERAASLSAGLGQIARGGIDVILSDLGLPDAQGLETFVKLSEQSQGVPIVVLTSFEDEALALEVIRRGAHDYLVKGRGGGKMYSRVIQFAIEKQRLIEDVKASQKKLEESYLQLKKLDQLKSDFISSVSHELHTPLTVITTAVNNFIEGIFGDLDETQTKWMQRIKSNTTRLTNLINDILDLSKLESGRSKLKMERFNIGSLINNAVKDLTPLAQEKNMRFVQELPRDPVEVFASLARVEQVLVNLLTNAIKYSPSGTKITVGLEKLEGAVRVQVIDEGNGIDPSKLEMIFERFLQLGDDKTTTPGIGLGLAICKEIAALHHGKIWAESEGIGKGSRFIFTLPLDTRKLQTVKPAILIVDDDEDALELHRMVMEQVECDTVFAKDGAEAIAHILASSTHAPFDLLIVDLQLPVRNGVQVIQEVKRVSPKTSVIVSTAYPDSSLVMEAMNLGHFTLLKKPFDIEEFREIIRNFIAKKSSETVKEGAFK